MQLYYSHIVRFIILLFFQVLILNNINIHGLLNPYIYPLFILLLPIYIPHGLLLLFGFLLGLGVDIFSDSMGLHAFASVLIGFIRPWVLKALAPPGGYETENKPTIKSMGLSWFITYTALLILIHHTALFYMEVLSFQNFWWTFLKVILSSILSGSLILLWEYLFYPKKK